MLPDSSPNSSLLVSSHLDFQTHLQLIFDSFDTSLTHPLPSPKFLSLPLAFCLILCDFRFYLIVALPSARLSVRLFINLPSELMKAGSVYVYFKNYVFSLFLPFITSLFYNEGGVFQVVSEQRKEGG